MWGESNKRASFSTLLGSGQPVQCRWFTNTAALDERKGCVGLLNDGAALLTQRSLSPRLAETTDSDVALWSLGFGGGARTLSVQQEG